MIAIRDGAEVVLPGLASVHSHAFQRALRGHCQRSHGGDESFWSWRATMYQMARSMTPELLYDVARFAYAEMAMSGVTAVGEFHYLHHQVGGQPYERRTELSEAMIRAARDVGLRICLQRVLYQRAGASQGLEPGQERFCDSALDDALGDIDALQSAHTNSPYVNIGVALHSVRALTLDWIREASQFAKARSLPLHMHLSEQVRELQECEDEHGTTPVALMRDHGVLDERFTAVHATHLREEEIAALGQTRCYVAVCRTTERDLGDGHCDARALHRAGARLCTGIDSHAISDPFEEVRAIELDQRIADQKRMRVADATELLRAATETGYASLGMGEAHKRDEVRLSALDPSLVGATDAHLDDAIVYGASPRAIRTVRVDGDVIVENGVHREYNEIRERFTNASKALLKHSK